MARILQHGTEPVNLHELLGAPCQVRRLAADILTTVAVFAGRPEPGTALMRACLPALLSYVADAGGNLRDVANILKDPGHLVDALKAASWLIDGDVLDAIKQPENGTLLRRWSTIVGSLSESLPIGEELERRTAQAVSKDRNEEGEDA
jgi:hypothetical protein